MAATKIQWCDETWNPVTGCTKISAGCQNCYAKRMAHRLKAMGVAKYDYDEPFAVRLHPQELKRGFGKKERRIFVCSMSDLFHHEVSMDFVGRVFDKMACNEHIAFQLLTKRPARMNEILNWSAENEGLPPLVLPNLWLGVTVENQKEDWRIPILLDTPAAVRFISVEPMLECVDTEEWLGYLDWVIIGPETGPGARECSPAWIDDMIADAVSAKCRCFVKAFPMPNGKVSHDIEEWPSWAQVQEYPR